MRPWENRSSGILITLPKVYTIGNVIKMPDNLFSQGRTLALHVYQLSVEGLYREQAYATAVILLVLVVGINALSSAIERRFNKITNLTS